MKRILIVILLSALAFSSFSTVSDAQRRRTRRPAATSRAADTSGKIAIPCPETLTNIEDCPDTGCGPSLDPKLNERKNIRSDDQTAVIKTIQDLKDLPDPVPGFHIGDDRDALAALGEGQKITVVANALVVRKGGGESCNCHLLKVADTDNHIVLVDRVYVAEVVRQQRTY